MNFKLKLYDLFRRITHRHDWQRTNEFVRDLPSSERPYWHVERCRECGAKREVMSL